jgi:iron complex outermembrane receptor protein
MLAEDFVHATFSDGTFVPKMPSHRLGAGISYRDSNSPPQFAARLPAALFAADRPTPGYNLSTAEMRYRFKLDQAGSVLPEMTVGLRG